MSPPKEHPTTTSTTTTKTITRKHGPPRGMTKPAPKNKPETDTQECRSEPPKNRSNLPREGWGTTTTNSDTARGIFETVPSQTSPMGWRGPQEKGHMTRTAGCSNSLPNPLSCLLAETIVRLLARENQFASRPRVDLVNNSV